MNNLDKLNEQDEMFAFDINDLVNLCHGLAKDAGWHNKPRETGTCLMLIVSEIAEAMEGDRKGLMDDHLPHRKMIEVELADAMIRICDLAGREGLDLGGALVEKLKYNQQRADHKPENRDKQGGKKY
jgi:NTP pyrophosphatase (non-canonical NTP hydrolase)